MTVEEMRKAITNKCSNTDCGECPLYDNEGSCYEDLKSEEIKRNYELMFGKEGSKMKNEFDFNELKAGYAIKVPAYKDELLVAIPNGRTITFYSKRFNSIVRKESILMRSVLEEYIPIEVYGLSSNNELFDPSTRPLLWKKEEDMNKKEYNIGKLNIKPNYNNGYKTKNESNDLDGGFIYVRVKESEDEFGYDEISIHKSELDDVINALTEIRDFIKED